MVWKKAVKMCPPREEQYVSSRDKGACIFFKNRYNSDIGYHFIDGVCMKNYFRIKKSDLQSFLQGHVLIHRI